MLSIFSHKRSCKLKTLSDTCRGLRAAVHFSTHLRCQLLHVGVDLVQDVVALLEQRVLGTHEGQHLQQTQGHIYASLMSVSPQTQEL